MSKFCRKCGTENKKDSIFCSGCGERLSGIHTNNTTTHDKKENKQPINKISLIAIATIILVISIVAGGLIGMNGLYDNFPNDSTNSGLAESADNMLLDSASEANQTETDSSSENVFSTPSGDTGRSYINTGDKSSSSSIESVESEPSSSYPSTNVEQKFNQVDSNNDGYINALELSEYTDISLAQADYYFAKMQPKNGYGEWDILDFENFLKATKRT